MEATKKPDLEMQRERAAHIRAEVEKHRVDGVVPRGVMQKVASQFGVTRAAVSQIVGGKRHRGAE